LQWWNLETGRLERSVELPKDTITEIRSALLDLSPDGKAVAIGLSRGGARPVTIQIRSTLDGKILDEVALEKSCLNPLCVALGKENRVLIAITDDEGAQTGISEWDLAKHAKRRSFQLNSRCHAAAVSPVAGRAIYVADPSVLTFFDLEAWKPL